MNDEAVASLIPECDHVYISEHKPGHRVYWVRFCMLCRSVDWDNLDLEIAVHVDEQLRPIRDLAEEWQEVKHADWGGAVTRSCGRQLLEILNGRQVTGEREQHSVSREASQPMPEAEEVRDWTDSPLPTGPVEGFKFL